MCIWCSVSCFETFSQYIAVPCEWLEGNIRWWIRRDEGIFHNYVILFILLCCLMLTKYHSKILNNMFELIFPAWPPFRFHWKVRTVRYIHVFASFPVVKRRMCYLVVTFYYSKKKKWRSYFPLALRLASYTTVPGTKMLQKTVLEVSRLLM